MDVGWTKVAYFKIVKIWELVDVNCWKDPHEWPLGCSMEIQVELANLLLGRLYSFIKEKGILSWALIPKGKFSGPQGYGWLDKQRNGLAKVP